MKKRNNKGFSLVELIVVIAIMAVLVAILAPQYLRYVERTRLQKDNVAISNVARAIGIACTNSNINSKLSGSEKYTSNSGVGAKTVTFTGKNASCPELDDELDAVIGTQGFTTVSNTYQQSTSAIEFTITKSDNGVVVNVSGWVEDVADAPTATSKKF